MWIALDLCKWEILIVYTTFNQGTKITDWEFIKSLLKTWF